MLKNLIHSLAGLQLIALLLGLKNLYFYATGNLFGDLLVAIGFLIPPTFWLAAKYSDRVKQSQAVYATPVLVLALLTLTIGFYLEFKGI